MAIKTFTTGELLTAADTNTFLANSGLVYVSSTNIANPSSAVSINNCFTSTYDNYRVIVRISDSTGANDCYLRFRVGGSDDTNGVYNWFYLGLTSANVSLNSNAQGQTFAFTGTSVTATAFASRFEFDVMSPFIAEETRTYGLGYSRAPGGFRVGGAHHTNSTSFDGFTIYPSANTWTGGTITVYGYRKG
jgi:hypothetical protein